MVSVKRVCATIGWLSILFPWLVLILIKKPLSSISDIYYTNASPCFLIALGAAGLLLFSYKGYGLIDDIFCTMAGVFAIGVCLFPCRTYLTSQDTLVGAFNIPMNISNIIHITCAILLFGILIYNSLFLFTKSKGEKTRNKKIRNVIYRICGIGMIITFCLEPFINNLWLVETIALFLFGISWLTKANIYIWLFRD